MTFKKYLLSSIFEDIEEKNFEEIIYSIVSKNEFEKTIDDLCELFILKHELPYEFDGDNFFGIDYIGCFCLFCWEKILFGHKFYDGNKRISYIFLKLAEHYLEIEEIINWMGRN